VAVLAQVPTRRAWVDAGRRPSVIAIGLWHGTRGVSTGAKGNLTSVRSLKAKGSPRGTRSAGGIQKAATPSLSRITLRRCHRRDNPTRRLAPEMSALCRSEVGPRHTASGPLTETHLHCNLIACAQLAKRANLLDADGGTTPPSSHARVSCEFALE
jgi:hypothetical protein